MEMHTRASLLATHGFDGSVRARSGFGTWLSGLWRGMQEAERRRRDHELLLAKDEHGLRDIGLTRADVVAFAYGRRPARRFDRG